MMVMMEKSSKTTAATSNQSSSKTTTYHTMRTSRVPLPTVSNPNSSASISEPNKPSDDLDNN